jgi:hypothetical protein
MEAKLKAKELLEKMSSQTYSYQPYAGAHYSTDEIGWEAGKKCALLFVEAMIAELSNESGRTAKQKYWGEVKIELEAL